MIKLDCDQKINLLDFKNKLIDYGYQASISSVLKNFGTFSVRGDSFYLWPVNLQSSLRVDFFGDKIEKIVSEIKKNLNQIEISENLVSTEEGNYPPYTYVVHPYHGIGIFQSIVTKKINEDEKMFIELLYAKDDKLFFPLERSQELMVYLGSRKPRLTRLHSGSWEKTKKRVKINLLKLARELLKIYSERSIHQRKPFELDKTFLDELATNFEFKLTSDQEKSLQEIISGLTEDSKPIDHLLVGDAGFGKTEVALRAAAIILAAGKQVAILTPTTLLAAQHASLVKERFKNLPIRIVELSRLTKANSQQIIKEINQGQTDLIVGTHSLLYKEVKFKNLGFIIIDEEQKFGVEQKEKIKSFRKSLDVLSLSATPIPRTLFMSLSGLRNLSLITEAPKARLGIVSQVLPFQTSKISSAITNELNRQGQVYLIYNRVKSIRSCLQKTMKMLEEVGLKVREYQQNHKKQKGEVVVAISHGQMAEESLARTMTDFIAHEIDILISSTIIESGLDHPNSNTLIVDHAERFGLSDLYQLRGRIGRRDRKAFAYFIIGSITSGEKAIPELTKTARNRLEAIAEIDEIGGGWQLALKDLEIRGAGNLLGREQHGFMEAVGLLLYSKLLKEAVDQVKKEQLNKITFAKVKLENE